MKNQHASPRGGAKPADYVDTFLLTSTEVARLLRVDQSSVNNWVRSGKLLSCRTPGGHNRIEAGELRKFLRDSGLTIPAPLRSRAKCRLLVVDDDQKELRRWQRQLAAMDDLVDLRCADNGIEGLLQVGSFRPHLVVLDYVMPGLNGIELCTRLRRLPEIADVRVVVMSSGMTAELRERAQTAGALAAWAKPAPVKDILALLGIRPEQRVY